MIFFKLPFITRKEAYGNWQTADHHFDNQKKKLEYQIRDLRKACENAHVDPNQGILRGAVDTFYQPRDRSIQKAYDGIKTAFNILGVSSFRRAPQSLLAQITSYAERLQEKGNSYEKLSNKLRYSRQVLDKFVALPEFCATHDLRLALIAPEVAEALFALWQKRLQDRQITLQCLQGLMGARLTTCRSWIQTFQENLDRSKTKKYQTTLHRYSKVGLYDYGELIKIHNQLDPTITELDHRGIKEVSNLIKNFNTKPQPEK